MPRCIDVVLVFCSISSTAVFVLIPFFTVSPVFVCDLPAVFPDVFWRSCKTLQLCIFINLHPEFDDHCTPVVEFLFKFIHLIVSTFPVIFTAESFQPFHHDTAIPGTVKDCNMPDPSEVLSRISRDNAEPSHVAPDWRLAVPHIL